MTLAPEGDARDPDAVIGGGRHRAGDMGTVEGTATAGIGAVAGIVRIGVDAVAVAGVAGIADEIVARHPTAPAGRDG
jgi:hypothetical protein